MDSQEAKKITKNLLFIKENLTQIEKIMDKLIEDECIGMDERADILTAKRADNQCHKLLDVLLKRGDNAFSSFIEALKLSGNQHVATRIQQTDIAKDDSCALSGRDDTFTLSTKVEFEEAEVLQLYEEKEMYEERVKELEVNCKILRNENSLKEHQIEKLMEDVKILKQSVQKGFDEIDNADHSCEEHLKKLEELESQCKILEVENTHLKIIQRDLNNTIKEKQASLRSIDQERQFYKQQTEILFKELKQLKKECADKDAMIKILNEQIKNLKTELHETKQMMQNMANESQAAMEQMKSDHANRFSQLDNKLDCVLKMLKCQTVSSPANIKTDDTNRNNSPRKPMSVNSSRSDKPLDKNKKSPYNRNQRL